MSVKEKKEPQADNHEEKPTLGISSCLLGNSVRYDGGHKRSRYVVETLGEHLDFVAFCPEVAIGLGTPRPPIRLLERKAEQGVEQGVEQAKEFRAVQVADASLDYTSKLKDYATSVSGQFSRLSGFIAKKASPSCGMERVKVYSTDGAPKPREGVGIFTANIMAQHPDLPVEEEGRLSDPRLRENFITRVFTLHRFQRMADAGITPATLVEFHARHKFLILAHDEARYRELGRLVAQAGSGDLQTLAASYKSGLMRALRTQTSPGKVANVMMHIMGFIKDKLTADEKRELLGLIEEHRRGLLPMIVPITLMNHFLRRHPSEYVGKQYFLSPHPREMMLRNHI